MKKMIAMMAVIAMAGVASAASFSWTSGNGQFYGVGNTGSPTTALDGGAIVLVYLGTDAGNIDFSSASLVTWGDSGQVATLNSSTAAGGILLGRATGSFVFTYADGDVANGQIYGVMYQDSLGALSNLRLVSDNSDITTTYTIAGLGANNWVGNPAFAWAGGQNFYAVPEPTSMALLALGVAAVGLRRKFRK